MTNESGYILVLNIFYTKSSGQGYESRTQKFLRFEMVQVLEIFHSVFVHIQEVSYKREPDFFP